MNSLLILIFIAYSSCLMENYYKLIYNLTKYSSKEYSSEDPSITVLDTTGIEGDEIYISFTFKLNLKANSLYYNFTNNYPSNYFNFAKQLEITKTFTTISQNKKKTTKSYTTQFVFNIPKEDKKYLVIQNLRYSTYKVTIENHKINPITSNIIEIILLLSAFVIFTTLILVIIFCKMCRKNKITSTKIEYKKEGPLSPTNQISPEDQPYSSSQSNTQNGLFPPQDNYYSGGQGIYQTGNTN